MNTNQSLATFEQFLEFSDNQKEQYIKDKMFLKKLLVKGSLKINKEKNLAFVENLVNLYTGQQLSQDIFSDYELWKKNIYVNRSKNIKIENGSEVLCKLIINESNKIKSTDALFSCNGDDLLEIEDNQVINQYLEQYMENLNILALIKPNEYDISHQAYDVLGEIIKSKLDNIDYQNKELDLKEEDFNQRVILKNQELQKRMESIEEISHRLELLGFDTKQDSTFEDDISIDEDEKIEFPKNLNRLIEDIQSQLYLRGYYYDISVIREVIISLFINKMIILTGPSGTGKTSILNLISEILGAQYRIIPVQPSWTDKQDLIGFYNPVRNQFVPTPLLDTLIEANENPDELFVICLDEMNLAQIEYYLADILSIREIKGESLQLYSNYEYKQNMDEVKWFVQSQLNTEEMNILENNKFSEHCSREHFEIMTRYNNLNRYKPRIKIPSNVRFTGTMNVEGAVQTISPKVIDRSFVIQITAENEGEQYTSNVTEIVQYDSVNNRIKELNLDKKVDGFDDFFEKIEHIYSELQMKMNGRLKSHIVSYYHASIMLGVPEEMIIDDIIKLKILPRIHGEYSEEFEMKLSEITLEKYPNSANKVNEMINKRDKFGILSYWAGE